MASFSFYFPNKYLPSVARSHTASLCVASKSQYGLLYESQLKNNKLWKNVLVKIIFSFKILTLKILNKPQPSFERKSQKPLPGPGSCWRYLVWKIEGAKLSLITFAPFLLVSYFIEQAIDVACLRVDVTIRDLFPFQLSISEQNT